MGVALLALTKEEMICPICGQPNNCQHDEGNCWCEKVVIPSYIIEMVPEDKRGKACICKSCVEKYTREEMK